MQAVTLHFGQRHPIAFSAFVDLQHEVGKESNARVAPASSRTNSDAASFRAISMPALDLGLLRDLQRVVNFDAKVPDCGLHLTVGV